MRRIRVPRPFAAIAVAAAVACNGDPAVLCACSVPAPYSILYGNVTDPSGHGVLGAIVHLDVGAPDCQTALQSFDAPTDATGRYRAPVSATGSYAEQCVRVFARAPAGSGFRDSDTARLTLPTPSTLPPDSVRRDLVLRAP